MPSVSSSASSTSHGSIMNSVQRNTQVALHVGQLYHPEVASTLRSNTNKFIKLCNVIARADVQPCFGQPRQDRFLLLASIASFASPGALQLKLHSANHISITQTTNPSSSRSYSKQTLYHRPLNLVPVRPCYSRCSSQERLEKVFGAACFRRLLTDVRRWHPHRHGSLEEGRGEVSGLLVSFQLELADHILAWVPPCESPSNHRQHSSSPP
jgi:hypothetical protein